MPEEAEARWFAESLATLLAGALLIRLAPAAVADGWCATRLSGARGLVSGTTDATDAVALIVQDAPDA